MKQGGIFLLLIGIMLLLGVTTAKGQKIVRLIFDPSSSNTTTTQNSGTNQPGTKISGDPNPIPGNMG